MKEYTQDQIEALVNLYANAENLTFPGEFEHRLDVISSRILYSLLREYKPHTCLEFGMSWGGTALVILKALIRNDLPYSYTGFEKGQDLLKEARRNLNHWLIMNLPSRIQVNSFGDIVEHAKNIPEELDFVFIDPDWDREIAEWTFKNIIPRVKQGGLVAIHDWSVTNELVYEGGSYPGIFYFIELFKEGKMPLKKIFSDWDWEDYRKFNIALSFWIKL